MNTKAVITYKGEPEGIGILHQCSVAETAPMHTHLHYFEVFLVVDGRALHVVNEHVDPLSKGSFVLVRPSDVHCYDFYPMHDFEFYNLSLSTHEFEKILALYNHDTRLQRLLDQPVSPVLQLDEAAAARAWHSIAHVQQQLATRQFADAKHTLKLMLCEIFWLQVLYPQEEAAPTPAVPGWLSELVARMHQPQNFVAGLPRMIALSGYSQEYLSRSCKQYLDLTPTQFINGLRLNHAAGLLRTSGMDTLAVCAECGFNNASHFFHLFKKAYGVTPKEHRRRQPNAKSEI